MCSTEALVPWQVRVLIPLLHRSRPVLQHFCGHHRLVIDGLCVATVYICDLSTLHAPDLRRSSIDCITNTLLATLCRRGKPGGAAQFTNGRRSAEGVRRIRAGCSISCLNMHSRHVKRTQSSGGGAGERCQAECVDVCWPLLSEHADASYSHVMHAVNLLMYCSAGTSAA